MSLILTGQSNPRVIPVNYPTPLYGGAFVSNQIIPQTADTPYKGSIFARQGGGFKMDRLPMPQSRLDRMMATRVGSSHTTQLGRLQEGSSSGAQMFQKLKKTQQPKKRGRRKKKK